MTFQWRKWDGGAHWTRPVAYLGSDEWGDWLGQRAGWLNHRPGVRAHTRGDAVCLLAPDGTYAATTWRGHPRVRIYIDVAWQVGWQDGEPVGIDMDLDVVRLVDGRVFIDDEDEWLLHRERYRYPADVVTRLESVTAQLEEKVTAARAPFDDATAAHWFAVLDRLTSPATDA